MQYSKKEQELIENYIVMNRLINLRGSMKLSDEEIVNNVKRDVDEAIMSSIKSGNYYLPENFGDLVFANNLNVDSFTKAAILSIHKKIPYLYADGVRDQDIREWWNLNDVERILMENDDMNYRGAMVLYLIDEGFNLEQAMNKMRKTYVVYGDPSIDYGDPNRPIPYELKNRILAHDEKLRNNNGMVENREALLFSSYNAYIRNEVKKGKL